MGDNLKVLTAELAIGGHPPWLMPRRSITITPMMDGNTSVLRLRIPSDDLKNVLRNPKLVGDVQQFCAPPPVDDSIMEGFPCSAGHTSCYISPDGDLYPCVQFPLPSGNLRREKFLDIWRNSRQLREVRSIQARDLPVCSSCAHLGTCTRCPGRAYMEGSMRGPSRAGCEKSLSRTGIMPASMLSRPRAESRLDFCVCSMRPCC
jgi:AdoMet-dependent heme synthase